MSDDPESFKETVDSWVKKAPERLRAVFRQSTQNLAEKIIIGPPGGVPVDTGFARASVRASLESMPPANLPAPPKPPGHVRGDIIYPYNGSEISVTIEGAELADTIYIGFGANYAIYLEYGHSFQAPNGFIRISVEQWPQIVSEVSAELKNRASL